MILARWGALLSVVVLSSEARADEARLPPRIALQWTRGAGAEACIAPDALEKGAEVVLERKVFFPRAQADAIVHGRIEKTPDGWSAHLAISNEDGDVLGSRDLHSEAPECGALDESLSLVLAIAIDSLGTSVKGPSRLHVAPPPPLKPAWKAEIAAIGHGSYGLLPGVAGGLGFATAVEPPHFWPVELDVAFWIPKRAEDGGRGADFTAWELGLSLCAPLVRKIVEPRICLGPQMGRLYGEAFGLPVTASTSAWLASARLRTLALVHLGDRFAVEPGVGLSVPFVRQPFFYTLDGVRHDVHEPAPVVFLFDLGFALTIP